MKNSIESRLKIQISITSVAIVLLILHLIWPQVGVDPVTIFLILLAVVPWLFPLFKSLEFPGGWKVEFPEEKAQIAKAKAKVEKEIKKVTKTPQKNGIKWNKVATLFWLGNDLMWIQDMTFRIAPPEKILQGVTHSIEYAEELGFEKNSLPVQELSIAKTILESLVGILPNTDEMRLLLESHYRGIRQNVQTVKWYIDALATAEQPKFKKKRAF